MNLATPELVGGASATAGLFGGNTLANHGDLLGSAYDDIIHDLGVTTLRFPGGSLTEFLFDIRNPDAASAFDSRSGEEVDLISLTEFMTYAEGSGNAVTIVLPTQTELSVRTDANGDRLPLVDEVGLRDFVQDVANGVYGNAEVRAFEIGNEYWGSGQMNAAEYGRLSAEMTVIIDDALAQVGGQDIDVIVQKGHNFGTSNLSDEYSGLSNAEVLNDLNAKHGLDLGDDAVFSSGEINWTFVNNEIVLSHFDTQAEQDALDGVVTHIYSRGADNPNSRDFHLDNINNTWREVIPDLDVYITEWNLKSTSELDRDEDYGLFQAHEMLNIMEEFILADVTEANVWPLIQNTSNPLSVGKAYEAASVSGEMFALMSETLPGKTILDFTPGDNRTTEQTEDDVAVHAFAGEDELALYVVNTDLSGSTMTDVDISGLLTSFGGADVIRLGVAPGELAGSNWSDAVVEALPPAEVIEDGFIVSDLLPGEILQIVLSDIVPTAAFEPVWSAANALDADVIPPLDADVVDPDIVEGDIEPIPAEDPVPDAPILPEVPLPLIADDSETSEDEDIEGDDGGLGFALAFLPLLLLFGLAG